MPVTSHFSPGAARGVHELCTRCAAGGCGQWLQLRVGLVRNVGFVDQ